VRSARQVLLNGCGAFVVAACSAQPASTTSGTTNDGGTLPTITLTPAGTSGGVPDTSLDLALNPELSRSCAREAVYVVADQSDPTTTIALAGMTSSDPSFSLDPSVTCDATQCMVGFCFTSTTPGAHATTIILDTSLASVTIMLEATVLPTTPDVEFATALTQQYGLLGNVVANWFAGGATVGDGLLTWSRDWVIGIGSAGAELDQSAFATEPDYNINWVWAMRTTLEGDVYSIAGNLDDAGLSGVGHFNADGTMDTTFGSDGYVELPNLAGLGYRFIELQPNNRLLAVSSDTATVLGVVDGMVDPTYGSNGSVTANANLVSATAIDAQGQLYIGGSDGCVRLTSSGVVDSDFAYTSPVQALAIDANSHVVVGTGSGAMVLDDTGTPLATYGSANVTNLACDSSGRLYVTGIDGSVVRYTSTGAFDVQLGFGTSLGVACPASGTCWIYGRNSYVFEPVDEPVLDGPQEIYALRLSD
jgi:hypothetical protein